jgi:predicted component of type VI protein secretion system
MRPMMHSRSTFQSWLPGRVMLPVGFALVIAAGTYMIAEGNGYARGKADEASAQQAQESVKTLARLVAQPIDLAEEPSDKGDQLDIPTMIRAIEPGAVYKPPQKAAAKPATARTASAEAPLSSDITVASLPAGVERFDQCGARCDSRDPMVTHAAAPLVVGAQPMPPEPAAAPATAPVGMPRDLAAASPVVPPAPVIARVEEPKEGFLGLPPIPTASEIVDRTVEGTNRAYDGMKQAVNGALDLWR